MATAVGGARTDQLLQNLQTLIRLGIEANDVYRKQGNHIADRELRSLIDQISVHRTSHVEKIQETLAINGIKPDVEPSLMAKFRAAIDSFRTYDEEALLHRAIDFESRIQRVYETVIVLDPLGPLSETLKEQRAYVATMLARLEELDIKRHM
jgi:uncharacterized protein (TIGR02284 family)